MSEMKVGMIGLDTSHVVAFAEILNNPDNAHYVAGTKVVAAFKGGSPDMPVSADRVDGFTEKLVNDYRLEIIDSIEQLGEMCDAILLESVDGRVHLEQFKKLASCKKPVFIDKPFTVSLADAKEIKELSEGNGTPVCSCSALRYDASLQEALKDKEVGEITGATTYGPAKYAEPTPGLFWYGIHSAEMLFAAMGTGCKSVRCIGNEDTDIVVGLWEDGRMGELRGIRKGAAVFGALLFREKEIQSVAQHPDIPASAGLMKEVVKFFQTGKSPIPLKETVEIMAFLEAANTSRAKDGEEVELSLS